MRNPLTTPSRHTRASRIRVHAHARAHARETCRVIASPSVQFNGSSRQSRVLKSSRLCEKERRSLSLSLSLSLSIPRFDRDIGLTGIGRCYLPRIVGIVPDISDYANFRETSRQASAASLHLTGAAAKWSKTRRCINTPDDILGREGGGE